MKKAYQQPQTIIMPVYFEQQLLSGSMTMTIDKNVEIEVNLSRHSSHSVWDEEEDSF